MTTIMVSPTARLIASMKAETMPGSAAGSTTFLMVSDLVAPMRVGAVAQRLRHRIDDVVRQRRYERDDHHSHHHAGGERAFGGDIEAERLPGLANPGRQAQGGEEAEHHGRDAGEDLEDRLGKGCGTAGVAYSAM